MGIAQAKPIHPLTQVGKDARHLYQPRPVPSGWGFFTSKGIKLKKLKDTHLLDPHRN